MNICLKKVKGCGEIDDCKFCLSQTEKGKEKKSKLKYSNY